MKRQITEEEAKIKLSTLCAGAEHCTGEMTDKLQKWNIPETGQTRIMEYLIQNKFVDDERFCRAFIKDKIKYNGWGQKRIEQALFMKHVDKSIYQPILEDIPDEMYINVLRPLIKQKWKSIKAKNDYERSMKLIKFAMGRGFSYDIIRQCIDTKEALPDD